jgi:serralysin
MHAVSSNAAELAALANQDAASVGSLSQLADYLVNGFWTSDGEIAHHWGNSTITFSFGNLTSSEQSLALAAMNAWHDVANVNFAKSANADITFNHDGSDTAVTSANWSGSGNMSSAIVDISSDWASGLGGGLDSYLYQTYIHEIGHALGLGHQGPYNGNATYGVDNIFANDSWQMSIMSYFSQDEAGVGSYRYVLTPQMADIAAMQSIYGAATTRTGDTTYGFHSNAGFPYDFGAFSQAPALTIYDSGGNDTFDASGYSNAQVINLAPGSFSNIGGLTNNIGIYTTTTIENGIGGSGSDFISGNSAANTLFGNGGNDALSGLAGADLIYGNIGSDVIYGNVGGDALYGGQNDDFVFGGRNDDAIYGNLGNDAIYGNLESDIIFAGQGNDTIFGGQGNDLLSGNLGNDVMYGGLGVDQFFVGGSTDRDTVMDFNFSSGDRVSVLGQSHSVGVAADGWALVSLSGGGAIELFGIAAASVTDAYFI